MPNKFVQLTFWSTLRFWGGYATLPQNSTTSKTQLTKALGNQRIEMQISNEGVRDICESVFSVESPHVVEAYSEYDKKPLSFKTSRDLEDYILRKISTPKGLAHIFVVYPEMKGKARLKKIELNVKKVPGHGLRYTWDGWGMINVQIAAPDLGVLSGISANSEARANKWASTYPEFEPPSAWDWKSVTKHKNRLKRVLKKYA